jgi:hypothetical protein
MFADIDAVEPLPECRGHFLIELGRLLAAWLDRRQHAASERIAWTKHPPKPWARLKEGLYTGVFHAPQMEFRFRLEEKASWGGWALYVSGPLDTMTRKQIRALPWLAEVAEVRKAAEAFLAQTLDPEVRRRYARDRKRARLKRAGLRKTCRRGHLQAKRDQETGRCLRCELEDRTLSKVAIRRRAQQRRSRNRRNADSYSPKKRPGPKRR